MIIDPAVLLFPHEAVRQSQSELLSDVASAIETKTHLIAHAPTGLGKTAATLAPAVMYALKNKLTVFFLTSRQTQHAIALRTMSDIKNKYNLEIPAMSLIGKKWMCLHPGVDKLTSSEFSEYCRGQREDKKCEFYVNTKKDDGQKTIKAEQVLSDLLRITPLDADRTKDICREEEMCPYEMALFVAAQARVIVADYYYVFHPKISEGFLQKSKIDMSKSILIIDEGHNLPTRMRELLSTQISDLGLDFALKEASKYVINDQTLIEFKAVFDRMAERLMQGEEILVKKDELVSSVAKFSKYDDFIRECLVGEETVLENQKRSSIGSVAEFLGKWTGADDGFARILSKKPTSKGPITTLTYRCLDPSLLTEEVIKTSHSTILMSGTLTPTSMYRDLLRFPKATKEREYESPFDKKNRMAIIVPKTTTKYSQRSEDQFKEIADQCCSMADVVPGNVAIFFPSYFLLSAVQRYLNTQTTKTVFTEAAGMSKQDKEALLEAFKGYKDSGAVLLGVSSGSFGEGIDLPGDLLKAVMVVGIPLQKPDLETQELVKYYDGKFRRGWDYGYVLPAITKTLQNAGRCIRTETDRGVIVFLDERYAWPKYLNCFPKGWNLKIKIDYQKEVAEFFEKGM